MNHWKAMMILLAVAGAASARAAGTPDLAAGHWTGQIDRGGWLQPLWLEIEKDGDSYRGEWSSDAGVPSEQLDKVVVKGDSVRFETERLLFVGHVQGSRLSGTISRKGTHQREGEFTATYDSPAAEYNPGSEPVFPIGE